MQADVFWRTVTRDRVELLDRVVGILGEAGVRYCVVGGQAVNAYVEPVVSLDLDLALAAGEAARIERLFSEPVKVERFPHSINLSAAGSDLRIQLQTDPRYEPFPERARAKTVLGYEMPVARLEDLLQGKLWAATDDTRRPSKRQKDLADIARLLEAFPELRERVPSEILERLVG